jgi:hypothetical protein
VHDHLLNWARGYPLEITGAQTAEEKNQEKELLLYQILVRLRHPAIIRRKETAAPEEYEITTAFPDPADSRVFWIQPLIHKATLDLETSRESEAGGRVAAKASYSRYLHGGRAIAEDPLP